jgi:DNA-binding response OmpR family regulator
MNSDKQFTNSKILIVDDNEDTVKLLRYKLEKEGFNIITAIDGNTGLEKAIKEEPDLILLDILMQGKDGIQTCSELKNDPIARFIPIIMMSAVKDVPIKVKLLEAGADDYITKPLDFRELMARIQAILRRTGNQTKERRFSVKLIHYLIRKFEKRGYVIYTPLDPSYPSSHSKWTGAIPDLFIGKGRKRRAFMMESMETLLDPKTVDRWKSFLSNPGVELAIIVHSKESRRAAIMLQKEYDINCRIIFEKERKGFEKSFSSKFILYRYLPAKWLTIILLCIITAMILSLIIGGLSFKGGFMKSLSEQMGSYQPRDAERQIIELQKQLNRMKGSKR